jgi:hypothetical protein
MMFLRFLKISSAVSAAMPEKGMREYQVFGLIAKFLTSALTERLA